MGAPVIWRTDSAAPPRESPSSLVQHDAGERQRLFERPAVLMASTALHGIDDKTGFQQG